MSFDVGDVWGPVLTVRDADGDLTDATVSLSVTSPSGTVSTPTVGHSSLGTYTADVPLDEVGRWLATWTSAGAVTGVEEQATYVRRVGSNVIPLEQVKLRLNKNLTVDDSEIAEMIDAAIAEYEEWVGPVGGSVTETFDGGRDAIILPHANVSSITAAAYSDGTTITVSDLLVSNGIVRWAYNTAGYFTWGTRNVTITYSVGALPANHRETIIADVAGYFEFTQRGNTGAAFPGQEGFEAPFAGTPTVLFPRIRALAVPSIA